MLTSQNIPEGFFRDQPAIQFDKFKEEAKIL
jgi:hypothetical protein